MSELTIIVAFDANRGIGIDNRLPWHLPEDLAHFKRVTSGHTIIMGRKTFESIGRPLPNRRNLVLTRDTHWQHTGIETVHSLEAAIKLTENAAAFIIGGADIFEQALPLCNQIIATEIQKNIVCDTFFPELDKTIWLESARFEHHSEKNAFDYAFVTYQKLK